MVNGRTAVIYVLKDPRDGLIRYVGKTNNPRRRLDRHIAENGNALRHPWLKELRELGIEPIFEIVETVVGDQWQDREKHWIMHYRDAGCDLLNANAGGTGGLGFVPSPETRQRISDALRLNWATHPRSFPQRGREKISALHKGRKRPPETGRNISAAKMGYKHTPESREKMSRSKRGKSRQPHSEETKQKLAAGKAGELNPQAKLTMVKAREIRSRYAAGGISMTQLGKEYGVDTKRISEIVRNLAWVE